MLLDNPSEELRLYQATVMLLSGQPRGGVDVLFFHNRSFFFQKKKSKIFVNYYYFYNNNL